MRQLSIQKISAEELLDFYLERESPDFIMAENILHKYDITSSKLLKSRLKVSKYADHE